MLSLQFGAPNYKRCEADWGAVSTYADLDVERLRL